jgi:hypothetical protein
VTEPLKAVRSQIERQVNHWVIATGSLNPDDLASPEAWARLERYLGLALRKHLEAVIAKLRIEADVLKVTLLAAESPTAVRELRQKLLGFRRKFMRTETTLDFFADAINTRTSVQMSAMLRACDIIAQRSMSLLLDQLGLVSPSVICYVDKGLGASMLKAGMRLWDGGAENPVAAIKIARHNLLRPTALIHEAGHQVAFMTGWNRELAETLNTGLQDAPNGVAEAWSSWSSEIAADAFAFVHTGYASVAALHDVLSGEGGVVFQHAEGDPHPISFLRVLLGVEMCRRFYGDGPWDALAVAWTASYPLQHADARTHRLVADSIPMLPRIVKLTLNSPQRAFKGRALPQLILPERVSPQALKSMDERLGVSLFTSMHWLWTECLRMIALTGWQVGASSAAAIEILRVQKEAMLRLGGAVQTA